MITNRLRTSYTIGVTTLAVLVMIAMLVFIHSFVPTELETQQDQEMLDLFKEIFSEAEYYSYDDEAEIYDIYNNKLDSIGYAFYAEGMGKRISVGEIGSKIPGPIVILVGLENKEIIKGIFVVTQNETPYFWNLLVENNYFEQFEGLRIEDAYFISNGGKVDAVSYATVSSNSVLNIVRVAVLDKIQYIN
jgi:Na+-translocating ferredoxin:NAD+ oxidoreductase RnfG subunit